MEAARVPKKKSAAKKTPKKEPEVVSPAPSLKLYRRIAGLFVILVAAVLATVLFVSTTSATIRVVPQPQTVETSFLVQVVKTAPTSGMVRGVVATKAYEETKGFPVTGGEMTQVNGKAGGTVTIVNQTGSAQPLVATTRLLSSTGVLFRLDTGVTVPAHGQVDAIVHADQEGPTGDIAPDKFTIPGLSTSLQALIFATSSAPMTGGSRQVTVVSQAQIDAAAKSLEAEMLENAKTDLRTQAGDNNGEAFFDEVTKQTSDTEAGTETDQFTLTMSMQVTAVFYDDAAVSQLAQAKLYETLMKGFEFTDTPTDNTTVTVQKYNVEQGTAQLRIEEKAISVVSATHPALAKDNFTGKTASEIKKSLVSQGLASSVEVDIFPPWIGTVPTLKDHIDVVIEKPAS